MKKQIDATMLKIIAAVAMVIDHIGAYLTPDIPMFRIIGRISIPIFLYFLVQGFCNTSNIRKYYLRLGLMTAAAFVPFRYMTGDCWNFGVTLIGSLVVLSGLKRLLVLKQPLTGIALIGATVLLLCSIHVSQIIPNLLWVTLIYLNTLHKSTKYCVLGLIPQCLYGFRIGIVQIPAMFVFWFLLYNHDNIVYNRPPKWVKYMFYTIYPIHLWIIMLIKMLML